MDESGAAVVAVAVRACYSGWGRSAGQLVWDKDYCSETVHTNPEGGYLITFAGPVSSRLLASKAGWVQTQGYNTTDSRIVLTKSEDQSSRLRTAAKQLELKQRRRLPGESDPDYYCRVILPSQRSVNLNYHAGTLAVIPALLESELPNDPLFAIRGSADEVKAFVAEARFRLNGEAAASNLSLRPVESGCGREVHFIEVNLPGLNAVEEDRVEILIPSISALFELQIRGSSSPH